MRLIEREHFVDETNNPKGQVLTMEPEQYEFMARAERQHWWYQGLRDAMDRCLLKPHFNKSNRVAILDAGCGTGGNLEYLNERLQPSYLGGFDLSEEAVAWSKTKCPSADVYLSDICKPEVHVDKLDLIVSCDVLYVPGLKRATEGMHCLMRHIIPGGFLILHLPAYEWLRSDHDRAVHTSERYHLQQARQWLEQLGMQCVLCSYRLCGLLPAIALKRLPDQFGWRKHRSDDCESSDLKPTANWLNRILLGYLSIENRMIARGVRLPFGSSILLIGRKPK